MDDRKLTVSLCKNFVFTIPSSPNNIRQKMLLSITIYRYRDNLRSRHTILINAFLLQKATVITHFDINTVIGYVNHVILFVKYFRNAFKCAVRVLETIFELVNP